MGPGKALGETHEGRAGGGGEGGGGVSQPSIHFVRPPFETSPNVLSSLKSSLTGFFSPGIFQGSRAWCQPMAFGLFMPLADCGVHQDGDRTPPYLLQLCLKRNNITVQLKPLCQFHLPFSFHCLEFGIYLPHDAFYSIHTYV